MSEIPGEEAALMPSLVMKSRTRWSRLSRRTQIVTVVLTLSTLLAGWWSYDWWTAWPVRRFWPVQAATHHPLVYSPDGKLLATTGPDGLVIRDALTGRVAVSWQSPAKGYAGAFSPNGRTFVALSRLGALASPSLQIELIDVPSGHVRATILTTFTWGEKPTFSPDGRTCRIGAFDSARGRHVVELDVQAGAIASSRSLAGLDSLIAAESLTGYALSADGRLLGLFLLPVNGGTTTAPRLVIWNLDEDREVSGNAVSSRGGGSTAVLAFAPDGQILAVGHDDGSIELRDVASLRVLRVIRRHSNGFRSLSLQFGPDGSKLASTAIFNGAGFTGNQLLFEISRLTRSQAFMPAPEMILLDVPSGLVSGKLKGEGLAVFSPDGRSIATISIDGTIKIRDVPGPP